MSVDVSSEKAQRLRDLLADLFQYDRADLDFGIYRILNQRRDEISRFLDDELIPSVTEAFAGESPAARRLEQALLGAEENARELDISPEDAPKVRELREKLASAAEGDQLADQVFADLTRFFARYYHQGDFLSLRRYRAGTYAVPYEGEEVLLHWANRDQYYIKSSESLASYAVRLPGSELTVRFAVVSADEVAGGAKPAPGDERRFKLADNPIEENGSGELRLQFIYVPAGKDTKQADLNSEAVERVLENGLPDAWRQLEAEDGDSGRSLLEKHIERFTARNTHDYFIHKDLGGFLRRELDFFVKNEVLHLDELENLDATRLDAAMSRARVLRRVAHTVIDFLAQVEEFQKRLWLKKKLVLESSWLVTLDCVPDELYGEVAANDDQRIDWVELLAIDQLDGYGEPLTVDFLRANDALVLDTRHFGEAFVDRLIGGFEDIEDVTLGVVVDGENFQALELLKSRYSGHVDCIYIDPPYNTGGDGFLYKDRYQHASWLAMMADRLAAARTLLADNGVLVASIDDDEHPRLRLLLDQVFRAENFVANVVWQKKYAPANDAKWFSDDHDHLVWYARGKEIWRPQKLPRTAEQDSAYKNPDNDPRGPWMSDNYTSNKSRTERPNGWYGIGQPNTGEEIWPSERAVWRYTREQHDANERDSRVWWGTNGTNGTPRYKRFLSEVGDVVPRTVWLHSEASHNQDAVRDLQALFGLNPFPSPKPVRLMRRILAVADGNTVIDFFAGSGTFGQAALEDLRNGAPRRFVLVEAGPHVESVLRPRMVKCLHAGEWKDGEPTASGGLSGAIKCLRIESYDDALDNLRLERSEAQEQLLQAHRGVGDDYLVHYMLDQESRGPLLNGSTFTSPAGMHALVTVNGETSTMAVDLVETFNLLLGLRVETNRKHDAVRAVTGVDPDGERVVVLWRDVGELADEALEAWFEQHGEDLDRTEIARIYVNGDCTLERLRRPDERWAVHLTDQEFQRLMFESADTEVKK
jgi:adenine-specific DNA-methyltransferase